MKLSPRRTGARLGSAMRLLIVAVVFWLRDEIAAAADPPRSHIQFLQVEIKDGRISLVRSSVRPGVLKPAPPGGKGPRLTVALTTDDGTPFWQSEISDPTIERIEAPDPEHPGNLITREIKRNPAEFQLRVPFSAEARKVKFYRSGSAHGAGQPAGAAKAGAKEWLGEISLPARQPAP